jgi:hypothetical protein
MKAQRYTEEQAIKLLGGARPAPKPTRSVENAACRSQHPTTGKAPYTGMTVSGATLEIEAKN